MGDTPKSACGHPVNANGNCTDGSCWNSNSKRNDGIGKD